MNPKLKWLFICQLLLCDLLPCQSLHSLAPKTTPTSQIPSRDPHEAEGDKDSTVAQELKVESARRVVDTVSQLLGSKIKVPSISENVTCSELVEASLGDDTRWPLFAKDLVAIALVPLLAGFGCRQEAEKLVLQLYEDLGFLDANEMLLEFKDVIQKNPTRTLAAPQANLAFDGEHHLQALLFNINQIASQFQNPEESNEIKESAEAKKCKGWVKVNSTLLMGDAMKVHKELRDAIEECEGLGYLCSGVSSKETFSVIRRKGSHILPQIDAESWIQECEEVHLGKLYHSIARRSLQKDCDDKMEQKVYSVVEWIPAVSTLYNLGTAVYYATINCTEEAKERAILTAVDLGTDALMAVTGGTAGIAGYAAGAGLKTGVKAGIKYLLRKMKKEEDIIFDQDYWTNGTMIVE
ncbi:UNVERIFIED_CONTAM: hypothetical protein FKN15_061391 [Acipenser sinensis]